MLADTVWRERIGAWQQSLYRGLLPAMRRAELRHARKQNRAPLAEHLRTGVEGENHAYLYLLRQGYTVVARRWQPRDRRGDLDLVGYDGETLVVFEVKTLQLKAGQREAYLPAEHRVDAAKRIQICRLLTLFVQQAYARRHAPPVRIDVLAVYLRDQVPEVRHFADAFPVELSHPPANV